ncbi:hypothetical protein BC829DRAFT_257533 [Chytridium lagenaria]|nr:hypothetical protein BC829DRAFT_257533 [Chytridium lagenaria]
MDKASRREDLENVEIGVDGLAEDGKDKEVSEGMSCLYCSVNEDHSDTMDECCRNIALEFRWMGRPTLCEAFSDKDEVEDGSADSASAFPAETLFANMLSGLCEAEDTIGLHCYRDFLTGLDRSLQLVVEIEALAQLRSTAAAAASTGIATLPRRPFLPNQTSPHTQLFLLVHKWMHSMYYGKEAEGVARERIQAVRLSERYFSEDDDSTPGESVSKHLEPVSPVSPGPASAPHGSRARFRRRGSFPKGLSGVTSPLRGDGEASTRRDGNRDLNLYKLVN